jgi:hypothetical protein
LKKYENHEGMDSTLNRYAILKKNENITSVNEMQKLLLLKGQSEENSVYRNGTDIKTVASIIIDSQDKKWYCTNEHKGINTVWQEIKLDFMP